MKNFYTIIYHTKVSLHENFQMLAIDGSVESQGGEVVLSPLESYLLPTLRFGLFLHAP